MKYYIPVKINKSELNYIHMNKTQTIIWSKKGKLRISGLVE
jgi:hypothetical protein